MKTIMAREKTALVLSASVAALFALGGIVWGLMADSIMLLFDGAYSLISLALSILALFTASMLHRPANPTFPFGYAALQPLSIAVKGITLGLLCVVSLASAVRSLLQDGQSTDIGLALAFATVSTVVCFGVWLYLRWVQSRVDSGLVQAESDQWLMDTVLSATVLAGFLAAGAVQQTRWAEWATYADPIMVVLVSGYFLSVPARMTVQAVRELLWAAPAPEIRTEAQRALAQVGIDASATRITKVGPYLVLDLDIAPTEAQHSDRLRFRLYRQLSHLPLRPVVFLNV